MKELEENGIGRPSTYAWIIATIEAREYMEKREAKLHPTELGFLVMDLLVQHFQDIINVEYTAAMEEELDEIEEGKDNFLNTLNKFWKKFEKDLEKASKAEMEDVKRDRGQDRRGLRQVRLQAWSSSGVATGSSSPAPTIPSARTPGRSRGRGPTRRRSTKTWRRRSARRTGSPWSSRRDDSALSSRAPTTRSARTTKRLVRGEGGKLQVEQLAPIDEKCPECGSDLMWRRGRFGAFIACSNYPTCKYIKKKEAREIGLLCPECGQGQVVERKGRWGRFFYGCRRYPECKFTAYHKPIAEPCPDCGRASFWRRRPRRKGRSSSAATRPATTSARPLSRSPEGPPGN